MNTNSNGKIYVPLKTIKELESPGASAFNLARPIRSYKYMYYCFDFLAIQDLK